MPLCRRGAFHSLAPALQSHPSLQGSGKPGLCCLSKQAYHLSGLPQQVCFFSCYVPTVSLQGSSIHHGLGLKKASS